ncbi:hypothetical protein GUITHDRAFT_138301 [Guillardia theta CCMP2712]|uniref:Mitochondrial carrier protein n=1 Tax=Guillardia theta (strain CCMP2712) TaxID=905079 RepID=L1JCC3_GUITC|nr:hypothetical protein GUITHDRAFT_138301 [Guillardia theta CCMP2712]EKX46171.1 hypothetical protein GUITHDRAFT_138301 [Guillardia theta CCMP2712]|eukprot:XP_005833151.1 hypothetical protein GUITHDRAFT_138301 [Guillardia theta CCMP2712]
MSFSYHCVGQSRMYREIVEVGGTGRKKCWQIVLLLSLALLPVVLTKTIPTLRAAHEGAKTSKEVGARRKLSFHEEMIAGALARAAAQCVMYPADVLKTLAQTRRSGGSPPTLGSITKAQLLKGSLTTSVLALPAGAIQFSVFRLLKDEGRELAPPWISTASIELMAAAVAAVAACVVQTPQEVIKQRMQAGIYPSFMQGVASLLRSEGLRGFYTGFLPTVARNTPTVCISFTGFARLKEAYGD